MQEGKSHVVVRGAVEQGCFLRGDRHELQAMHMNHQLPSSNAATPLHNQQSGRQFQHTQKYLLLPHSGFSLLNPKSQLIA